MRPTDILTGLIALASGAHSAALPRNDPYVGDLRTFGQVDCSADNQGVGTFTQSMTGICNQWPEAFSSIYVHLTDGWVFHAYTTSNCSDNGTFIQGSVPKDGYPVVCNNSPTKWIAYTVDRLEPQSPSDGSPTTSTPTSTPTPPTPPHGPPHGWPPHFGPPSDGSTQNNSS
ncbi:uncharacterized protein GGS22DRAFT_19909 [Annulohypoxylon maeteangense]|uniref:uncharacterized protein n=1 Tax=Annulohypoxylon maeteangense TaxID=1927788 RepID=UPI002007AD5A|nr:uncharacterized protein GGS22DRAFT_19909 [Annulohypoxylon maeteangense]KAI0884165.1 hypothetical protein GGS22DRAFT_19909 [Annulohypoxylon maeteangense]